jgi:plastocyanin
MGFSSRPESLDGELTYDSDLDYGAKDPQMIQGPAKPTREVSVIITPEGYFPKTLSVFEGEQIHFFITSTLDTPSCFILAGKEVFISANKGRLTEATVDFKETGKYKFYCPSQKFSGHVTVLARPNPLAKLKRDLASVNGNPIGKNRQETWRPKEY